MCHTTSRNATVSLDLRKDWIKPDPEVVILRKEELCVTDGMYGIWRPDTVAFVQT